MRNNILMLLVILGLIGCAGTGHGDRITEHHQGKDYSYKQVEKKPDFAISEKLVVAELPDELKDGLNKFLADKLGAGTKFYFVEFSINKSRINVVGLNPQTVATELNFPFPTGYVLNLKAPLATMKFKGSECQAMVGGGGGFSICPGPGW